MSSRDMLEPAANLIRGGIAGRRVRASVSHKISRYCRVIIEKEEREGGRKIVRYLCAILRLPACLCISRGATIPGHAMPLDFPMNQQIFLKLSCQAVAILIQQFTELLFRTITQLPICHCALRQCLAVVCLVK